jgi:hypothetical protein
MSPCLGGDFELLKEVIFVCYVTRSQLLFAAVLLATLRLLLCLCVPHVRAAFTVGASSGV